MMGGLIMKLKSASIQAGNMKRKISKTASILIITACALFALLVVCAVFILGNLNISEDRIERVVDHGTVIKGVSVSGIDVSGFTKMQVAEATARLEESILSDVQFTIDIDGEIMRLLPDELGVDTNYDDIIKQAFAYGHTGTFDDRKQAAETPKDFCVLVRANEENVKTALASLKQKWDKQANDATYEFMASGYLENGTEYNPETYDEETLGEPQFVMVDKEDQPNELRYQYYNHDEYAKEYKPIGANISRFLYTQEQKGIDINIDDLTMKIIEAVDNNDYSTIKASVQVSEPKIKIDEIKNQTQLICSWTSSYRNHNGSNRIYNVTKLSGIINGKIIKPGETWSINEETGPRTLKSGWKPATGLSGGRGTLQPGGGVCQISSTLYNAALRADLKIVEAHRHSIISDYIPIGLDATITTGGKNLRIKNPYDTPLYIVSYMNPAEKNVTVEIYGPSVIDEKHGPVILDFKSDEISHSSMPETIIHHNATHTPDGTPIDPGQSVKYITARRKTTAQTYILYLSLDGEVLEEKEMGIETYRSYTGHTYINDTPVESPVTDPTEDLSEPPQETPDDQSGTEGED